MTLIQKSKGIYVDDSFNLVLPNIDSIFDCDGVLIDITKSSLGDSGSNIFRNFSKNY